MPRALIPVVLAAAAATLAAADPASAAAKPAGCTLQRAAELHVTMRGTRPMVPIKINGQDTLMLADSGAVYSTISPEAAKRLGLKMRPGPYGMRLQGVGGSVSVSIGVADEIVIDRVPLKNIQFLVAEGAGVGGDESAGLLGQNVLGFADVEYDLANGAIRLLVPKNCEKAMPAYWSKAGQDVGVIDVEPLSPATPHLRSRAKLNGQSIDVMLDTGASTSVLTLAAARRLGFRPDAEGVDFGGVSGGIGRRRFDNWIAPFDSFEIGGEVIKNTRLRVADLQLGEADMLLGADFFLAHRVYVSRKQRKVYFTYNGGPVFKLDREPDARRAVQAAASGASEPVAPAAETLADAAAYARRAAAHLARRDFDRAVADYTRAAEMEPREPKHLVDRGMARLASRQPILAMVDFDQALKLKPDDRRALLARGQLYIASRQPERAEADFQAALKAAGATSEVRLAVAEIYSEAEQYERAVAHYDAWIAANPSHEQVTMALNGRCWARALWGKQLEAALADCDSAIRRAGRLANVLDSRGLVKLRLGRLDEAIADYDAALKLQPRIAWSLYGRGVARLQKGQTAQGRADIAAAVAIDPGVRDAARRAGVREDADAKAPDRTS
ncbi:aspartyl protease family protein [Phenylobacterium sp.]|jgi:tetratricopeptide (TPR) repeat protein|uniref:aspartyl protease family protein n=1 Tax=Phenylobacterium sp. TaxID=1871053 RepID=UPI002F925BD2